MPTMIRILRSPRTTIVSLTVTVAAALVAVVGVRTDARADTPSPAARAAVTATRATITQDWVTLVRVQGAGQLDDVSVQTQARYLARTVPSQPAPVGARVVLVADDPAPGGVHVVTVQVITGDAITTYTWTVAPVGDGWSPTRS